MPPKGRIKHANQHDKRHDTGLAAPGKRISKDKAQTTVASGSSNGRAGQNGSPAPSASASGSVQTDLPTPETDADGILGQDLAAGGSGPIEEEDCHSGYMSTGGDMTRPSNSTNGTGVDTLCSRDTSSIKVITSHAVSSLSLAATILSACPLRDAIAILILFLSLPPTLIIAIHSLFASLTFLPQSAPSTLKSGVSLPSFADWFQATSGGGPSPFTILVSDIVMTLLYLVCPLHLQNIFMDLGQAVIAISLSGAAAETENSTRSVAICSTIIFCSHLFRYKHASIAQLVATLAQSVGLEGVPVTALSETPYPAEPVVYSWPRLLLGCHLVAQGLLTLIRRWFAGTAQKKKVSKLEAEQATLLSSGKLAMLHLDNHDAGTNSSTDGRPPGPPATVRDPKEKMSNSKKKRKQATQARSEQPLWAALATTKVTFMKGLEQKQNASDAAEVYDGQARDETLPIYTSINHRIWILDIGSAQVNFKADMSPFEESSTTSNGNASQHADSTRQRPFYVRLNGADWSSTRITTLGTGNNITNSSNGRVWAGEIYGLSPLTRYKCELIKTADQTSLCAAHFVTLPAPDTEQTSSTGPIPPPQPLRPMSPTSTLKQSIVAAEAQREEIRNRSKRNKKEHQKAATAVRRDIELLQNKIATSNVHDEKSRARILQLRQQIKQAEDVTQTLREQYEALGEIPREVLDKAAAAKKSWSKAKAARDAAFAAAEEARLADVKEVSGLKDQLSALSQKRERLIGRKAKLEEQIERHNSEVTANQSARQRYQQERAFQREEQSKQLNQMIYWIQATRAEADNLNARANELYASMQGNDGGMHLAHLQQQLAPPTPEGNLPGTNGPLGGLAQPFEFVPFGQHNNLPQQLPPQGPPPWNSQQNGYRQRSSSMLSGYSGFTDDHVELVKQQAALRGGGGGMGHNGYGRHGSDSDGSTGSTGGGSSNLTSWAQAPSFTLPSSSSATNASSPGPPAAIKTASTPNNNTHPAGVPSNGNRV